MFNIGTDSKVRLQKKVPAGFRLAQVHSGSDLCFSAESVLVGHRLEAAPARPCGIHFPRLKELL